jgi:hypothetical protein
MVLVLFFQADTARLEVLVGHPDAETLNAALEIREIRVTPVTLIITNDVYGANVGHVEFFESGCRACSEHFRPDDS